MMTSTHQAKEATDDGTIAVGVETSKTNDGNNKRKREEEEDDGEDDGASSTRPAHTNNNKRRKHKKGGNKNKKNKQHHNNNKQKRNWIESCSDSINRIPTNCVAPLTCVITRSEIEEEPLLPNQQVNGDGSGLPTSGIVNCDNSMRWVTFIRSPARMSSED